ncbi:DoxX family protein [Leptospira bouyouniensis]|uniref:DoxX family protein n=1 Tax=Leptospira bouyouniensis TaxID=2484911 RepID=A0ABY2L940_9LEPT|nr:DoxX family protein [Leptospira bouyouniensis]TGK52760.1 DoxX family protein [Leptospira bouyouniensis]
MKRVNLYYWIATGLVVFFLLPGSVMNIMQTEDWLEVFKQLGYPAYLLPFLGVAKISACIAIVLPNLRRLKEWAYAGLVFDIVGAIYSALMAGPFDPRLSFMILPLSAIFASYFLWHKKIS